MRMDTRIWSIRLLCFFLPLQLIAQINTSYQPSIPQGTVIDYLQDIQSVTGVSLTYSSTQVDALRKTTLDQKKYTIEKAIEALLPEYDIELIARSPEKIVMVVNGKLQIRNIYGYVKDSWSDEALYGATLLHMPSGQGTYTNENGYYHIPKVLATDAIKVSYIGYKDTIIQANRKDKLTIIKLTPKAEVSTVVISDKYLPSNPDNGGDILRFGAPDAKNNILGDEDLFQLARTIASVSSGSEGQGGIMVRAGTSDQNLIMLDDVPLYAVNHMADISSIFLKEATRDAQLISGGFPARYSGRLSSVLSVHMKEGNTQEKRGNISAGLPGVKGFLEGPIGEKTSFMLGGRKSWINTFLDPLIDAYSVFEDIDISYHDFVSKINHRINNTSSVSISAYLGGDKVNLRKLTQEDNGTEQFTNREGSKIKWDNQLVSLQYNTILGSKWQLSAQTGLLQYSYQSSSEYNFLNTLGTDIISRSSTNLLTNSEIRNSISNLDFDYYLSSQHRIKVGGQYYYHHFSPKVIQDTRAIPINEAEVNPDSITVGHQISVYLEDTYTPNSKLKIYAGLNYSRFNVRKSTYNYLQPRISIDYSPSNSWQLNVAATRMVQFVHLLVNNGLGQPSDLWVPSTNDIAPELSDQYEINIQKRLGRHFFKAGAYIKKQQNVIIYSNPESLFSNIFNSGTSTTINFMSDRDWERQIETGIRNAHGIEFSYRLRTTKWNGSAAFARNISRDKFDRIDDGEVFRSQFDRPVDVNLNLAYTINPRWTIGAHWVYGSGNTFTLSLEEFDSVLGISLQTSETRNNYRMPAYHHLDLNAKYSRKVNGKGLEVNFGIYNVYNRLNPYYLYLYNNPVQDKYVLKKLSLFPIFPHLEVNYGF